MSLVLDTSAILAWVYHERSGEQMDKLIDAVVTTGAWVPSLWHLEVANVMEANVRRQRHDSGFRDASLADLSALPIRVDAETSSRAWGDTLELAERHRLTLYDAAYLELAKRRLLPIATLDRELHRAALREGVEVLDL
jgi:predicted nucleic acid-binding protein